MDSKIKKIQGDIEITKKTVEDDENDESMVAQKKAIVKLVELVKENEESIKNLEKCRDAIKNANLGHMKVDITMKKLINEIELASVMKDGDFVGNLKKKAI